MEKMVLMEKDGADGSGADLTPGTGIAISDETISLNAGLNDLNDVMTDKNSLHLGKDSSSDSGDLMYRLVKRQCLQ